MNCQNCQHKTHKRYGDTGYCYMFKNKPEGSFCGQYMRERLNERKVSSIVDIDETLSKEDKQLILDVAHQYAEMYKDLRYLKTYMYDMLINQKMYSMDTCMMIGVKMNKSSLDNMLKILNRY